MDNFVLYWIDKSWQKRGSEAKNEYLTVDASRRCFRHKVSYINIKDGLNTVEVVRKKDIKDFMTFLKGQGYTQI